MSQEKSDHWPEPNIGMNDNNAQIQTTYGFNKICYNCVVQVFTSVNLFCKTSTQITNKYYFQ